MSLVFAFKVSITAIAVFCWFYSQKKLGQLHKNEGDIRHIKDLVHDWTAQWHHKILQSPALARWLLILSSLVVDMLGVFLLYQSLWGATIRPLMGLILVFSLRQLNQAITLLPAPKGMIWTNPRFPSVFVTYGVSNDLFFSGHTALAVLGALELAQRGGPLMMGLAAFVVVFEILTVLILRAHWTMDVFAGAITALWVFEISSRFAPGIDLWLSRFLSYS